MHALNHGGIPLPHHTIEILHTLVMPELILNVTLSVDLIAKYGMQETHSIVLIQWSILSYKQTVRAPVESADEKKLPTG